MRARWGHSLAELVVATTVLGVGLSAAGAAAVTAHRWTERALLRERAYLVAMATLDSLVQEPAPFGGAATIGALDVRWRVDGVPPAARIVIDVRTGPDSVGLVSLEGRHLPAPPLLPPD